MKTFAVLAVVFAFGLAGCASLRPAAVPVPPAQGVPAAPEAPAAKTAEVQPVRVAVVFEKSVRNREVLELAVQEALRDAGYVPVLATGVRRLGSERDWGRLPTGTAKVLVISDARVTNKRTNETAPSVGISKTARIGARVRWQKTIVSLDAKMVNTTDRAVIGFGHGEGDSSNVERVSVSTGGVLNAFRTGGLFKQQSKEDAVYKAAKEAATEAIKSLR